MSTDTAPLTLDIVRIRAQGLCMLAMQSATRAAKAHDVAALHLAEERIDTLVALGLVAEEEAREFIAATRRTLDAARRDLLNAN